MGGDDILRTMAEGGRSREVGIDDGAVSLTDLIGSVLGGTYRLDGLIGEGGMGAVFRARHVLLRRDVAIKISMGRSDEHRMRFDREAQLQSRFNHPNVVGAIEYGSTSDGLKYLVMPLLSGNVMTNLLGERISTARAVGWAIQIARGLEHAHLQGIVHRDLKPGNIMVTRDASGEELLQIFDFGLATISSIDLQRPSMVVGTFAYMSPEQCLGVAVDARSDLYNLGLILHEMLTGLRPFNHENPIAVLRMHVSDRPPLLPSGVYPELAEVTGRLLAKPREDRFPDARAALLALERCRDVITR